MPALFKRRPRFNAGSKMTGKKAWAFFIQGNTIATYLENYTCTYKLPCTSLYMKPYTVGIAITPYNTATLLDIWFIPADCGDPSPPMDGFVMAYDSTLEGSQIVFQCNPGRVPSQQIMSVCAANNSWTPDPADLVCRGTHNCLTSSNHIWPSLLSRILVIVSGSVDYTTSLNK